MGYPTCRASVPCTGQVGAGWVEPVDSSTPALSNLICLNLIIFYYHFLAHFTSSLPHPAPLQAMLYLDCSYWHRKVRSRTWNNSDSKRGTTSLRQRTCPFLGGEGSKCWVSPTRSYCIAQRTLLNVWGQPGWEGSLGEKGYMFVYGWVPLLKLPQNCYSPPETITMLLIGCTTI